MKFTKNKNNEKRISTFGLRSEVYFFIENLSLLVSTGMGLIAAISIIEKEIKSRRMSQIVERIGQKLRKGSSFSSVLNEMRILPMHSMSIIETGEETGKLEESLRVVVVQNDKERVFRSKVRSSMLYSVVVVVMTIVIGVATAVFTLPRLAGFFEDIEVDLPLLTKWLIATGEVLGDYGYIIVPAFVLILLVVFYFLFSFPKTRFIGHSILFRVPVIRNLIKQSEVARFGFIFGTMLESGMSVKESLENIPGITTFRNYKKFYIHLGEKVGVGNSFHNCFVSYEKIEKLFPASVIHLIMAAEQSGKLSDVLFKIGNMYEAKVESTAKNLPVLLEPALIIINGIIIATLALGIILPIYSLVDVI
ncbi:type II secretion system F family protein [Patescibacteria group bacterium]